MDGELWVAHEIDRKRRIAAYGFVLKPSPGVFHERGGLVPKIIDGAAIRTVPLNDEASALYALLAALLFALFEDLIELPYVVRTDVQAVSDFLNGNVPYKNHKGFIDFQEDITGHGSMKTITTHEGKSFVILRNSLPDDALDEPWVTACVRVTSRQNARAHRIARAALARGGEPEPYYTV